MGQIIADALRDLIGNDILTSIVISILPLVELRGGILASASYGMPWYESLIFCWIGSSLVVPFLLLLLKPILNAMKKIKGFRSLAETVESMFEGKAAKIKTKANAEVIEKKALHKKMLGVFAFVAIPLPLTGAWTGSAVAVFLGLKFWQALPMVLLGNLTAGGIMTVLSVVFKSKAELLLDIFAYIVLAVIVFYVIMMIIKMVKKKKAKKNSVDMIVADGTEAEDNLVDDVQEMNIDDDVPVTEDETNSITDIENDTSIEEDKEHDTVELTDENSKE